MASQVVMVMVGGQMVQRRWRMGAARRAGVERGDRTAARLARTERARRTRRCLAVVQVV